MRFDEMFEMAAGSVTGRMHTAVGKANQDAYALRAAPFGLCGVVCDGCGSGVRNEVGASVGARIISEFVLEEMKLGHSMRDDATWERIRMRTIEVFAGLLHFVRGKNRPSFASPLYRNKGACTKRSCKGFEFVHLLGTNVLFPVYARFDFDSIGLSCSACSN